MRVRILIAVVAVALAVLAAARAADEPVTQGSKTPSQDAVKEPAPPPSVTVIGARDAHGILGRDVRSAANEDMGRIVDVIVDREGTVRAAVIDFGGFLGVGSRKIVVDWNATGFRAGCQQERQHHARTEQGTGHGGARIQGGCAGHRAWGSRPFAAMGI